MYFPAIAVFVLAKTAVAATLFDPLQHLAGIAPYFEDPVLDPKPPQGCNVTKAAYLIRHAAIYASDFDYERYIEPFTKKLQNSTVNWRNSGALSFLESWQSPIPDDEVEDITSTGKLESYKLGVDVRLRYPQFRDPEKVWTSTAERTQLSAQSFVDGLVAQGNTTERVLVSENKVRGADSLTPYQGCPKYSSSEGSDQSSRYLEKYAKPIIARFKDLAPGFNFTADDIVGMQELCGYETVIRGNSPFCSLSLFPQNEWLDFEYMNDILYFYNTGYGNQISGPLGYPWLNASASVLLSDSATQDLYASFTHRELPPTVLVAMGLFNNSATSQSSDINSTMPLAQQNYGRVWKSSRILPFLANIAIERLKCDSYGFTTGDYFRVLVNQAPQPLSCAQGPGESCSKSDFQDFIQQRNTLFGGYTAKCQPEYTNSTDALTLYA